jgi:hypothetical protein
MFQYLYIRKHVTAVYNGTVTYQTIPSPKVRDPSFSVYRSMVSTHNAAAKPACLPFYRQQHLYRQTVDLGKALFGAAWEGQLVVEVAKVDVSQSVMTHIK